MIHPLVSVIIPAYGHAEFILQAVDSVFAQSFRDYEIIVVNDGSPDNTAQVLATLAEHGKIHYYEQTNSGVASARNFGIEQAKGKYVAFLDDDDLWTSQKLEWQVDLMEREELVGVGGNASPLETDATLDGSENDGSEITLKLFDFFGGSQFHSPGQVLIRRDILINTGCLDSQIWGADDLDLWMRLATAGKFLRKYSPALKYRIHESNASHAVERMLVNTDKVFKKHLKPLRGAQKRKCGRRGYRWLFDYLGRKLLAKIFCRRNQPGSEESGGLATSCLMFRVFFLPVLSDPKLGITIARASGKLFFDIFWYDLRRSEKS